MKGDIFPLDWSFPQSGQEEEIERKPAVDSQSRDMGPCSPSEGGKACETEGCVICLEIRDPRQAQG